MKRTYHDATEDLHDDEKALGMGSRRVYYEGGSRSVQYKAPNPNNLITTWSCHRRIVRKQLGLPAARSRPGYSAKGRSFPRKPRGPSVARALPPGWTMTEHFRASGAEYKVYMEPQQSKQRTFKEAWRVYNASLVMPV